MPAELFDMRDRLLQKRTIVATAVRQVVDLLRKAGVAVPDDDAVLASSMPEGFKPPAGASMPAPSVVPPVSAQRGSPWISDVATDMNDAFYDALRQYRNNIVTEERFAGSKMYERLIQRTELLSLFNPANVYFHPNLTQEQQLSGLKRLRGNLVHLGFDKWCDVPLFMTIDEWSAAPGRALVFPYNFSIREMRLYLMNELPRVRLERQRFQTALENAIDMADYLIDNSDVFRISMTADIHPGEACETLKALTEIIMQSYEAHAEDLDLHHAINVSHFVLTRHVLDTEVRSTNRDFYVLIPRNFDARRFVTFLKQEYVAWLGRIKLEEKAIEKKHNAGPIAIYTQIMGLPVTELTKKARVTRDPSLMAEAPDPDAGLTEEQKAAKRRAAALRVLFDLYLRARNKIEHTSSLISGWITSLGDAKKEFDAKKLDATGEHQMLEVQTLQATLLPLSALAELKDAPVHSLGTKEFAPLPESVIETLVADPEVMKHFDALLEQVEAFAVVLRDEMPELIRSLPRTRGVAVPAAPPGTMESMNNTVYDAIEQDDLVNQLESRLEHKEDLMDSAVDAAKREMLEVEDKLGPRRILDEMDKAEDLAAMDDLLPLQGEWPAERASTEILNELGMPFNKPHSRYHKPGQGFDAQLRYTPLVIERLAQTLPRELPVAQFFHSLADVASELREVTEHWDNIMEEVPTMMELSALDDWRKDLHKMFFERSTDARKKRRNSKLPPELVEWSAEELERDFPEIYDEVEDERLAKLTEQVNAMKMADVRTESMRNALFRAAILRDDALWGVPLESSLREHKENELLDLSERANLENFATQVYWNDNYRKKMFEAKSFDELEEGMLMSDVGVQSVMMSIREILEQAQLKRAFAPTLHAAYFTANTSSMLHVSLAAIAHAHAALSRAIEKKLKNKL